MSILPPPATIPTMARLLELTTFLQPEGSFTLKQKDNVRSQDIDKNPIIKGIFLNNSGVYILQKISGKGWRGLKLRGEMKIIQFTTIIKNKINKKLLIHSSRHKIPD